MTISGHIFCRAALVVISVCAGWAEPQEFEGKKIKVIQFVPTDQPVDPEEIHRILPLKQGEPLRLGDVQAAIDRLYATGHYADIQVDAELSGQEVVVRFITVNTWFIGSVAVEGNIPEPPNRGQLENAANLNVGEPHTEDKIKRAVDGMEQLLKANGIYETRIEPEYSYDPKTQQIHVRFVTTVGTRGRYRPPIVTGDPKMPTENIVKATRWKGWFGWRPVTQSRTQSGLKRVRSKYQDQDRLMARVAIESAEYEPASAESRKPGVIHTLGINAGPKVEVRLIGANVRRGRVEKLVPIYEERTVDRDLLEEGRRNLRDFFQSQGYFNAEVEFKQQRIVRDRAVIDYLINRGRRHKLVRVEIKGNRYFDRQTIRERMFLMPASFQFRQGRYSEVYLRRDEESITNLYRENGFREVKVTHDIQDNFGGKPGNLAVTIIVDEGPQWFVAKLELVGVQQLDRDRIQETLSSAEGQPFSEFNVAVDRDNILARYFTEGFPDATFEWASKQVTPNEVELRFEVKEGKRRFVRQVLTSGLETTRPDLVNRNIELGPGDPLSQIQMAETQKRLYDLGVFARVNMAIQNPEGETQNKYVLYEVEEAKRYTITTGFGAQIARIGGNQTSLADPGGQAGFSPQASFDVSRRNFRGLGHVVSLRSRASALQRRVLANYLAPRIQNTPGLNLSFTALYEDTFDVRTFTLRRREASVQLSQRRSKDLTALYRFSYRRNAVSDLKVDPLLIPQLSQPVRVGILSLNLLQDRRDDPVESRRGIYNTVDLGLASQYFGSQADFGRFLVRNSTYRPLGRKLVFARSTNFGALFPFNVPPGTEPTAVIPIAEHLFGGGAFSHRGFAINQAGPRDQTTGFPLGGQALLFNNFELRFPLLGDNIGGVIFQDSGNVYSTLGDVSFSVQQGPVIDGNTNFNYMVHAMGFGIRYRTPIGPVRVDVAYGFNPPRFIGCTGGQETFTCGERTEQRIGRIQFFFSIGQAF